MKTSWKQRILDLEQSGLSLTDIAAKAGLAKSTVSGIKSGAIKAPGGDAAVVIYKLHKRRCTGVESVSTKAAA